MMNNTRSLADRYARSRESTNVLPAIKQEMADDYISRYEMAEEDILEYWNFDNQRTVYDT